jgi:hypothetical protein
MPTGSLATSILIFGPESLNALSSAIVQGIEGKSLQPCNSLVEDTSSGESIRLKTSRLYPSCIAAVAIGLNDPAICRKARTEQYHPRQLYSAPCLRDFVQYYGRADACDQLQDILPKASCVEAGKETSDWKQKIAVPTSGDWRRYANNGDFPPPRKTACERIGGKWYGQDVPFAGECRFPSEDEGKKCNDGSRCKSGICAFPIGKHKDRGNVGTCAPYRSPVGNGWYPASECHLSKGVVRGALLVCEPVPDILR